MDLDYFTQQLKISDYNNVPRFDFFRALCEGQRVLHIGCADFPFVKEHNLHLFLKDKCLQLYGVDTSQKGLDTLHLNGIDSQFLSTTPSCFDNKEFDVVLVPEVLEHVPYIGALFAQLKEINTKYYVITVPCAIQCARKGDITYAEEGRDMVVTEVVHPEHLCWYSPYTLYNTIKTHTDWSIENMFWNNGISVGCVAKK